MKKESYNIWSLNFVTAYIMHYVSVLPHVYKGQNYKNNSHKKDHNITHDRYRILNALTWKTLSEVMFSFNKDNNLKWLVLAIVKCKTQVSHEPSAATLAISTTGIRLVQTVLILSFEFPLCFIQLSVDDFTMYGGVFGNKQDSVFQNLEVCWCVFHLSLLLILLMILTSLNLQEVVFVLSTEISVRKYNSSKMCYETKYLCFVKSRYTL